jgi:hypothetical protein
MTMKMLSDPRPANLYIGPDRVACYNEAFSIVAASRHPMMMAATCKEALPATWPFLSQMMLDIERTGVTFSLGSFEMSIEKTEGFLEEYAPAPCIRKETNFLGHGMTLWSYQSEDKTAEYLQCIIPDSTSLKALYPLAEIDYFA